MDIVPQAETSPLRRDSSGGLRIGNSHVLLELVIHAFENGATPEAITQRYLIRVNDSPSAANASN